MKVCGAVDQVVGTVGSAQGQSKMKSLWQDREVTQASSPLRDFKGVFSNAADVQNPALKSSTT